MVSPLVGQMKNNFNFSSKLNFLTEHVTTVCFYTSQKKEKIMGNHLLGNHLPGTAE